MWSVNLPTFNGVWEAEVAVGTDPALAEATRLHVHPVVVTGTRRTDEDAISSAIGITLRWVWATFVEGKSLSEEATKIIMNYSYAALMTGLIAKDDGDVVVCDLSADYAEPNGADEFWKDGMSDDDVTMALTLGIATKASFWLTNHHLGTSDGTLGSYVGKVAKLKLGEAASKKDDVKTVIHTIGHWTSTRIALDLAGVRGISQATPIFPALHELALSKDATLGFTSLPAGTHRLAVAFESAKSIVRSKVVLVCPSPADFTSLGQARRAVRENPARYHIGSQYLTGAPRMDYDDAQWDGVLGRLGSYVTTMTPKSTLAKSPHLAAARIQSYPDFDSDFAAALSSYKLASTSYAKLATQAFQTVTGTLDEATLGSICDAFNLTPTPSQITSIRELSGDTSDETGTPDPEPEASTSSKRKTRSTTEPTSSKRARKT